MTLLQAIIIAIVEGITEFLPISSTGHMIITEKLLGVASSDLVNAYIVNIQFGAILSVIVLYWKRFFQSIVFYLKLFVAFLPAAVLGIIFSDYIDSLLGNVVVVAISLVIGGVFLIFVDNLFKKSCNTDYPTYKQALIIGFFQVISMIPGVSRSAATIVGGMQQKLSRKAAAEFSFFLAVPTMFAASCYKLLSNYKVIGQGNIHLFLVGNIVAFVVALLAIKSFIAFLTNHGFRVFGYYRALVGVVILILLLLGYNLNLTE